MPELTREEKLKLVEKLPQRLQDFLYSEDTGAVLLSLGRKYNLSDDKVRLLSKLVGDVALGILSFDSLPAETGKLAGDPNVAAQIFRDLNTELFSSVAAFIKGVPAPQPAPPAPAPAPAPPRADQYREPTMPSISPEAGPVINLRPAPPPPSLPAYQPPPALMPKPVPPLTFTRPVMPPGPAEEKAPDTYREPIEISPAPLPPRPLAPAPAPQEKEEIRQFILRSPGMPPAEPPILDLRQDKGEF